MFVGTVIVYNQMKIQSEQGFSMYLLEETDKLLVSMIRHTVADNFVVPYTECRKQGGRAVAFVIASHRSGTYGDLKAHIIGLVGYLVVGRLIRHLMQLQNLSKYLPGQM